MTTMKTMPTINADDFARRFALRAAGTMWFLGAGASASAGIPTAWDMVWEFKQRLFTSQRRVSPKVVADLSSDIVRSQLQAHIDAAPNMPRLGDDDEYAALFEAVYPAEPDRRSYLDSKMAGAKPSYGHLALATLMRAGHARIVWSTNFDPLVADACAKIYDATGPLTTVALDAPDLATQLIAEERWPIEVKLHGDFRSRRLKNTCDELRHQDARLRQALVNCCRRFGMIVVGYSGRDESVMGALEEAINEPNSFPSGLFWLHRGDSAPLASVARLITRAAQLKIDAALVSIANFDEVMRDLLRQMVGLDTTMLDRFNEERRRWSPAPSPTGRRVWPVVRLNALPLIAPTVCRRIECQVGGSVQMHEAVERAGVDLIVARRKQCVLAFGSDADLRAAFGRHAITAFDLHTIETKRLRYESAERGLLREALTRALARNRKLEAFRRRGSDLLAPQVPSDLTWQTLRQLIGKIEGRVDGVPGLAWREGIAVSLEWADDRLWLLVEPRTVFVGIDDANRARASDFARERVVKRYNRQLNELVSFWAQVLAGDGGEVRAFAKGDGVDAVFSVGLDTGFSWRASV